MLGNAIQHYWKLVVQRLYHMVPWLVGHMHFSAGILLFFSTPKILPTEVG